MITHDNASTTCHRNVLLMGETNQSHFAHAVLLVLIKLHNCTERVRVIGKGTHAWMWIDTIIFKTQFKCNSEHSCFT